MTSTETGEGDLPQEPDGGLPGASSNPLLNEDILEQIVTFLPLDSLKQCRLVASLWNLVTNRVVSEKCKEIQFGDVRSSMGDTDSATGLKGVWEMRRLINLLDSGWSFPCKKFSVECELVKSPEDEQTLNLFFRKVGPWATHLKLVDNGDESERLFRKLHPRNIQYAQLKSLTLMILPLQTVPASLYGNLEFAATIVQNAPKLQGLHLSSTQNPDVVTGFLSVMELGAHSNIKFLSLEGDVADRHLVKVQEMGVQLESFSLEVASSATVTGSCLENFLEGQREHLKELNLDSSRYKGPLITLALPNFPKLRAFGMSSVYRRSSAARLQTPAYLLSGISYQQQLPALRRLAFTMDAVRNQGNFLHGEMCPSDTVEELELSCKLKDPMVVVNAARVFPNLKKLKVPARTLVVRAVYELMENVEELTLETKEDLPSLDSLLTGYSKKECAAIKSLSPRLQTGVEIITEPVPFLHRLRVLRLLISPIAVDEEVLRISDISCRLILLKMRNLRCLDFCSGAPQISEAVLAEMKDKFTVCGQIRNEHFQ